MKTVYEVLKSMAERERRIAAKYSDRAEAESYRAGKAVFLQMVRNSLEEAQALERSIAYLPINVGKSEVKID